MEFYLPSFSHAQYSMSCSIQSSSGHHLKFHWDTTLLLSPCESELCTHYAKTQYSLYPILSTTNNFQVLQFCINKTMIYY